MESASPSDPKSPFTALTAEEELRLWPLAVHARHLQHQLRYVDYRQAERDAALLAQELLNYYPAQELRRATFIALPRGGLIVLGLLAYQIELKVEQLLTNSRQTADLVCLVDDCALSGLRLEETLDEIDARRIVVTHLYSAPGLRSAVQKHHPRVERCLAAHDLAERTTTEKLATEADRLDTFLDGRLYPGPAEIVAFAWNEPDLLVLTPFDDQPAHQWRFLPPHKCLKNRQALGLPPGAAAQMEWIVPDGIVYGWFDGILYLLDTKQEEVYRLDGFAADCWRAAAGYGTSDAALGYLQRIYQTDQESDLARRLQTNLIHFETRRLLRSHMGT